MTRPKTPLHSVDFYDWNVLTQFKLRGDLFKDPVLNRVASYFNEGVTYLLNGGYVYKARGSGKWMALPKANSTDSADSQASKSPPRDYPKELLELIISDADSASSLEECKIVGRDPASWAPEHRVLLERATESNPDLSIVADFLAIGGTYAKKDNYLFRVDNGVDRMVVPRGDVRDQLIRECLEGISEGEDPVERVQTMVAQYYVIPELELDVERVMSAEPLDLSSGSTGANNKKGPSTVETASPTSPDSAEAAPSAEAPTPMSPVPTSPGPTPSL